MEGNPDVGRETPCASSKINEPFSLVDIFGANVARNPSLYVEESALALVACFMYSSLR
jgi:hypothetical protein